MARGETHKSVFNGAEMLLVMACLYSDALNTSVAILSVTKTSL